MGKFAIGQIVYARASDGTVYQGEIEDSTWEPDGHVYSVRTPVWREKKWWKEAELSDLETDQILQAWKDLQAIPSYCERHFIERKRTELQLLC